MPQNQRRQQDQELSGESSDTQTEEEEEQAQERGVSSNSYQNMAETAFVLELYQFLSSQEVIERRPLSHISPGRATQRWYYYAIQATSVVIEASI